MMKKVSISIFTGVWIVFCLAVQWSSCTSESTQNNSDTTTNYEEKTSELALLMRQMHEDAKDWRQQILETGRPEGIPLYYGNMLTATPTEERDDAEEQTIFISEMMKQTNAGLHLFDTTSVSVTVKYNELITSCISCHKQFCPGPIRTIKKLYIPEN